MHHDRQSQDRIYLQVQVSATIDGRETIFFPYKNEHPFLDDVRKAHSWVKLDGERFCIGVLEGCPFCDQQIARLLVGTYDRR